MKAATMAHEAVHKGLNVGSDPAVIKGNDVIDVVGERAVSEYAKSHSFETMMTRVPDAIVLSYGFDRDDD